MSGGVNRDAIVDTFKASCGSYIEKLTHCIQERFKDLVEKDVFKALKLFDVNTWPKDKDTLQDYGLVELSFLTQHCEKLLEKKKVSLESINSEWDNFKYFWLSNLTHLPRKVIWSLLITSYASNYPNLAHIIELLLVFPASNAIVERGFSTMRRIKTDWRCCLAENTLDHLMRISLEGPQLSSFNPDKATAAFFATPRRPNVQPYKRKMSERESDDSE